MTVQLSPIVRGLLRRQPLLEAEAHEVMEAVAAGTVPDAMLAAFLAAYEAKGPTEAELAGFARALRDRAIPVDAPPDAVDTCGTGGDGKDTCNVSTIAALVVAGCGVAVAKHGNRSASGRCGSADVLEALGVPVDRDATDAARALRREGFAFLFAPRFHPALRHAAPLRRALGFRTVFNLLGPLLNPARIRRQVIGVATEAHVLPMGRALARLGADHALVVHGAGGIDELSTAGTNTGAEVQGTTVRMVRIDPRPLGLEPAPPEALRGGGTRDNAAIARAVLAGHPSPARDTVLLNAAAALVVAGVAADLRAGLTRARSSIDEGRAAAVLRAACRKPEPPRDGETPHEGDPR